MSFEHDVAKTVSLENAYRRGLEALRNRDRAKITTERPRKLAGSAHIDAALGRRFPNEARWDYAIAWGVDKRSEEIHWVEVHPASRIATIGEVSAKLSWLKRWLKGEGSRLDRYKRGFIWIASGKSGFQQNSPQLKTLGLAGIYFAGGHYTIAG